MSTLFRKELLENITTYRFYVLTCLLTVLMVVSILVSYGDYRLRMENFNVLRPQGNETDKIILPPEPLSIFVKGIDENLGRLYSLSSLGIQVQPGQQSINRLFSLFTVPDTLFVIKVVLALIAILFSFDAVSGEKEQGTLKLLLAHGMKRTTVAGAKILGRFTLVFLPFVVLFLLSASIIALMPDVPAGVSYWTGIGVIAVASALYVLIWTGVGTLVSTFVQRSASGMVLGLSAWLLFVFIIPNLGTTIAESVYQVPPSDRVDLQNRLVAIQSIFETLQKVKKSGDQREFVAIMNTVRAANSQQFENYTPKLNKLVAASRSVLRFSPAGSLELFLTDAANTGISADQRLKNAVWLYIDRNFKRFGGLEKGTPDQFGFERESFAHVFAETGWLDLTSLIVFCALSGALSLVRIQIYDPR